MKPTAPPTIEDLPAALLALAADWKREAAAEQFGAIGCTMRECANELIELVKRARAPRQLAAHFLDEISEVTHEPIHDPTQ